MLRGLRHARAAAAAALCLAAACAKAPADERPNIILIISDDQDYEHLGFLSERTLARTPSIDSLAEEGTFVRTAYGMPRCRPALAALLSGRYAHASGIYATHGPGPVAAPDLLPRLLGESGYASIALGKFFEGDARDFGFDEIDRFRSQVVDGRYPIGLIRTDQKDAFEFLERTEQPFFMWYAPLLPHVPHNPPQDLLDRFPEESIPVPDWIAPELVAKYRRLEATSLAMVSWLDAGIGKLLERIEQLDLERETLIVFLIDNGWANGFVSKGSPYEKSVRTPFIFHWPGRIRAGGEVGELASIVDVMPTLLDYAGLEIPDACQGRSLRRLLEGGEEEAWRETLFGAAYRQTARETSETPRPEDNVFAVYARTPRWKYVLWLDEVTAELNEGSLKIKHMCVPFPDRAAGDEELFDLDADEYERSNLAGRPEQREILADLREQTLAWWERTGGAPLAAAADLPRER